jgi:succinyl-diaminopimelate desuccinylase
LTRLEAAQGELSAHELLGPTTVAPTIIEVDTQSGNVTPAWARVWLDFRTASESPTASEPLWSSWPATGPTRSPAPGLIPLEPLPDSDETIYGFYTPPDREEVIRARAAIAKGMGREPALTSYQFATDGRHFVPYGLPMIGYSPAEEHLAHTVRESISIAKMEESLRGHVAAVTRF